MEELKSILKENVISVIKERKMEKSMLLCIFKIKLNKNKELGIGKEGRIKKELGHKSSRKVPI